MADNNNRTLRSNLGDSIATALPIDIAAQQIDPGVLSALARWRDVDQFSLGDLSGTLWTKSGDFAADNAGYLHALHGFVAEKVAYDHLISSHAIEWPQQTNVPALDMVVDGTPVQIKEGTSAYEQAQHALKHYPTITSFITDPLTAQKLQEQGVEAVGVEGLDPQAISSSTDSGLLGLHELEQAGQVHVPILTTVFSLCKYWERYDAEHIDAQTALRFAATDIAAQSIGAAAGLKLAAVYVVGTGGFGIAILPLTAGAILGAMGLRNLINKLRAQTLREALARFVETRVTSEMAAEITIDFSRTFSAGVLETARGNARQEHARFEREWAATRDESFRRLCSGANHVCRRVASCLNPVDTENAQYLAKLTAAFAQDDLVKRYIALQSCLAQILSSTNQIPQTVALSAKEWMYQARAELLSLEGRKVEFEAAFGKMIEIIKRNVMLELFSEYALLLARLIRIAAPTISALDRVRIESERLGVKWQG